MADVKLKITGPDGFAFTFEDVEIPESMPFGGEQMLASHQLVGGARVIDAMGRSDKPLRWRGIFRGQNAETRARYLDGLRISGREVTVTWGGFSYQAVIRDFHGSFDRFYWIPYTIELEVSKDNTSRVGSATIKSIDDAVAQDMARAKDQAASSNDSTLDGLLDTLDTAISAVSSFASAAQTTINSVLAPIKAVQGRVDTLIAATGNTLQNVTTLGGVVPNNPLSQQAAQLTANVTAQTQSADLYALRSTLARMSTNVSTANQGNTPKTVTVNGGTLYSVAAKVYGDASKWRQIATANGLTDPVLTGTHTLTIPPA